MDALPSRPASAATNAPPRTSATPREEKEWTVLLYWAGDNNLDAYAPAEHRDLVQMAPRDRMNVVMQWDRGEALASPTPSWTGCRRIEIRQGADGKATETVLSELGPTDMAAPETLRDFLVQGMTQYPARHTMVVLKDHGHAWEGVLDDDSHHSRMPIAGLKRAFEEAADEVGRKPDVIAFDACGMANAEVLVALKDTAGYLAASEKVMYAEGFPYREALTVSDEEANRPITPRDMAARLVTSAAARPEKVDTFAAFDLSQTERFHQALDDLSQAVADAKGDRSALRALLHDPRNAFMFPNSMDLPTFLEEIKHSRDIGSPEVKQQAEVLTQVLDDLTVAAFNAPETGAGGLSIANAYSVFNRAFHDTQVAQSTAWSAALAVAHPAPLAAGYALLVRMTRQVSRLFGRPG